jgi:soluble lytic murein transglycosylase-like protein
MFIRLAFTSFAFILFLLPAQAEQYSELIKFHADKNNVPFSLANSMIRIESKYNANARSGPNIGLGQISLPTAKSLGYSGSAQGLLNAETNLTYSIKYLAQAYRLAKGDTCGTVMRYQNGLRSTHFSAANRVYCAKVKAG